MVPVTINMDGTDRKLYYGIQEMAAIETREGAAISDLIQKLTVQKMQVGIWVSFLWAGLQRFYPDEFKGEKGWSKIADILEEWLKKGNQNEKWGELGKKITDSLMGSGIVGKPESPNEPGAVNP